jgi:small subunit ribosomal protein S4
MKTAQKYKICRRLGPGVYEKCQTPKFVASLNRHSKGAKDKRPKPMSAYGTQFLEKQRVRFTYGISEKQFANYIEEAINQKGVLATDALFELLESRLDNVVYRLGLAHTRRLSRQMVSHGHFTINGKKTTIPSYRVKATDKIAVREGSKKSVLFADVKKKMEEYTIPNWLALDNVSLVGTVQGKPKNSEGFLDLNTVLEFYSR